MRIVFIVGSLNTGGAEKVLINYINEFSNIATIEVELFTISLSGNLLSKLNSNIKISYLYRGNDQILNWGRIRRIFYKSYRRVLKEVSFQFPFLFSLIFSKYYNYDYGFVFVQDLHWFSKTNFGKRKYLWIQNNLKLVKDSKLYQNDKFTNGFEKVVAISDGIYEDLTQRVKIDCSSILKINNPINSNEVLSLSLEVELLKSFTFDFERPFIVSMGRLIDQKGFDILIEAFRICKHAGFSEKLVIIGGGSDYQNLTKLASSLSLVEGEDYLITGIMKNPYPIIKKAKLFVCSSRFDGLSTSINEAMALGVPIVSTPCEFGPKEILKDSKYGLLSSEINPESLSITIQKMLTNISSNNEFSKLSLLRSQDFDIKNISKLLIDSLE